MVGESQPSLLAVIVVGLAVLAAASCTASGDEAGGSSTTMATTVDVSAAPGSSTSVLLSSQDWSGWVGERQSVEPSWDGRVQSTCSDGSPNRIRVLLGGDARDADRVAAGLVAYTRLFVEAGGTNGVEIDFTADRSEPGLDVVVPVAFGAGGGLDCAPELLDPVSLAVRPSRTGLLRWNFASLGELDHLEQYLRQDADRRGPVAIVVGETAEAMYGTAALDRFATELGVHFDQVIEADSVTEALQGDPRAVVALGAGIDCINWIDQRGSPPDGELLFLTSNECHLPGVVEHQVGHADGANVLMWTTTHDPLTGEPSRWWFEFVDQLSPEETRVLNEHSASFERGVAQAITLIEVLRSVGWDPSVLGDALESADYELTFDHPTLHGTLSIAEAQARLDRSALAVFNGESGWIDTDLTVQPRSG